MPAKPLPDGPLRAALIGAGRFGTHVLGPLRTAAGAKLVGLSDRDPPSAEAAAAEGGCPGFTDHRRLLAETNPDVVFLTVPPAPADDLVRLIARHGAHLWREPPPGRDLVETVQLCRVMDEAGLKYSVGAQRRFAAGYRRARQRIAELGQVYLVEARYLFNYGGPLDWRGDRSAGGGALRTLGHQVFDLVAWMLGIPETIYCVAATGQRVGGTDQPVYDTDDTAVVVGTYPGRTTVNIIVSRCFNPVSEGFSAYAEGGSIDAGPGHCTVRDRDGTVLEHSTEDQPPAQVVGAMIDAFLHAVSSNAGVYECSAWESVLPAAMAEAATLSDRTRQAESPARLLTGCELTAGQCLRLSPSARREPR